MDIEPEIQKWLEQLEDAEKYINGSPFIGVYAIAIGFTAAAYQAREKHGDSFPEALDAFLTDAENFTSDFLGDDD